MNTIHMIWVKFALDLDARHTSIPYELPEQPWCVNSMQAGSWIIDMPILDSQAFLPPVMLVLPVRQCRRPPSSPRCRDRVAGFLRGYEDRGEAAPFLFILNILVPGNPLVATVMYWALDGTGDGEGSLAGAGSSYGTFLKMLERWGLSLGGQWLREAYLSSTRCFRRVCM